MLSYFCLKIIFLTCLGHLVTAVVYVNDFDQRVDFKCQKETQTISRVQSVHDNGPEDRRFGFECRDVGLDSQSVSASCAWSVNFENNLDRPLDFECAGNAYVNGMISEHDNGAEDRRWKFYCCKIADIHMYDCELTGWTNDFDQPQDYRVPSDKVMKGVFSEHDNGPEDRRYKYEVCNIIRFTDGQPIVG